MLVTIFKFCDNEKQIFQMMVHDARCCHIDCKNVTNNFIGKVSFQDVPLNNFSSVVNGEYIFANLAE